MLEPAGAEIVPVEGCAALGRYMFASTPGLAAGAEIDLVIDLVKGGSFVIAGVFGLAAGVATFCLLVPRLRDCASVNGIAQTARSASRINALQRRCALMECLVCFFI